MDRQGQKMQIPRFLREGCRWKGKPKALRMLQRYLKKKGWYLKIFSNSLFFFSVLIYEKVATELQITIINIHFGKTQRNYQVVNKIYLIKI